MLWFVKKHANLTKRLVWSCFLPFFVGILIGSDCDALSDHDEEWQGHSVSIQKLDHEEGASSLLVLDQKQAYVLTDLTVSAFAGSPVHSVSTAPSDMGIIQANLEIETCPAVLFQSDKTDRKKQVPLEKTRWAHCSDQLSESEAKFLLENYGKWVQPAWGSVHLLGLTPHQQVQWCAQFSGCYLDADNTQSTGVIARVLTQTSGQEQAVPRVLLIQVHSESKSLFRQSQQVSESDRHYP
jgi:hypothetical protein